ncbi:S49 family peptidase [Aliiroseovarius sp.]|uniref:S49 family peptidase n=1 Tax=Aliiroseovarius sp. TaxID=1872442 RepID=UPI002624717B|nr:S49 family peptidase [Aliiroseovarius sp.]
MKRWIPFVKSAPTVAVIRLQGMIASGPRGQLNDAGLAPVIERAFRRGKPDAVALVINSPGGSPAQSSLIAARIRRLAEEKEIPVIGFVEDVAASGGYWLACAADEIFVDESSILGSIGVISAGFGFPQALEKLGVERRVHTAGKSKSMMDPFRPEKAEDVERLKALQEQIHQSFIRHVRNRRARHLPEGDDLFTGDVWIGQGAVDKGLADGVGHLVPIMKTRYGKDVRLRMYGQRRSLASRLGLSIAEEALGAIEDRAGFARFGL